MLRLEWYFAVLQMVYISKMDAKNIMLMRIECWWAWISNLQW